MNLAPLSPPAHASKVPRRSDFIRAIRGEENPVNPVNPVESLRDLCVGKIGRSYDGCLAGTRTPTSRIRICGATITPRGNESLKLYVLAGSTGLEPATPGSTVQCANQLRHNPVFRKVIDSIPNPTPPRKGVFREKARSAVAARRGESEKATEETVERTPIREALVTTP